MVMSENALALHTTSDETESNFGTETGNNQQMLSNFTPFPVVKRKGCSKISSS